MCDLEKDKDSHLWPWPWWKPNLIATSDRCKANSVTIIFTNGAGDGFLVFMVEPETLLADNNKYSSTKHTKKIVRLTSKIVISLKYTWLLIKSKNCYNDVINYMSVLLPLSNTCFFFLELILWWIWIPNTHSNI